jgi:quercetin 2,3-dioxygenase
MNVLRAQRDQLFEYGPFTIRRQRPGEAFGPLAIVDQMTLKTGARVPMHSHQNDEIFTYVWRGSSQHQHEDGERTPLNAKRVMVVNAGDGLRHEESAPLIETEMLQAYIRPASAGGEGRVQQFNRPEGAAVNDWTLLAGPEGSDAPLTLRQAVYIYDLKLARDQQLALPQREGFAVWVTLLDGVVRVGDQRLHKGDAISDAVSLPEIRGERDATLIAFLVKADAPAVLSGTVSGQL